MATNHGSEVGEAVDCGNGVAYTRRAEGGYLVTQYGGTIGVYPDFSTMNTVTIALGASARILRMNVPKSRRKPL